MNKNKVWLGLMGGLIVLELVSLIFFAGTSLYFGDSLRASVASAGQLSYTVAGEKVNNRTDLEGKVTAIIKKSGKTALSGSDSGLVEQYLKERKDYLTFLAKDSPATFYKNVQNGFANSIRGKVSGKAREYLETQNSLSGTLLVRHFDEKDAKKSRFDYLLITPTGKYSVVSAGSSIAQYANAQVAITGYVLDKTIVFLNDKTNFKLIKKAKAVFDEASGPQRLVLLPIRFTNSKPTPSYSLAQLRSMVYDRNSTFQRYYREISDDKVSFVEAYPGRVTDYVTINREGINEEGKCEPTNEEVRLLLSNLGITVANGDRLILAAESPCGGAGWSWVGLNNWASPEARSSLMWLRLDNAQYYQTPDMEGFAEVFAHEFGHTLGVIHANGWNCVSDDYLYGDCSHGEYDNLFDVMGRATYSGQMNAVFREAFGWFRPESILDINQSGSYTLNSLESGSGIRMAKISNPLTGSGPIYFEWRQPIGFDARLKNTPIESNLDGLMVNIPSVSSAFSSDYPKTGYGMQSSLIKKQFGNMYDPRNNKWSFNEGDTFNDQLRGISVSGIKIDNSKINFSAKLSERKCINLAPYASAITSWPSGGSFDPIYHSFEIGNSDQDICAPDVFSLEIDSKSMKPDYDYDIYFSKEGPRERTATLSPGEKIYVTVEFTPKAKALSIYDTSCINVFIKRAKSSYKVTRELCVMLKPVVRIKEIKSSSQKVFEGIDVGYRIVLEDGVDSSRPILYQAYWDDRGPIETNNTGLFTHRENFPGDRQYRFSATYEYPRIYHGIDVVVRVIPKDFSILEYRVERNGRSSPAVTTIGYNFTGRVQMERCADRETAIEFGDGQVQRFCPDISNGKEGYVGRFSVYHEYVPRAEPYKATLWLDTKASTTMVQASIPVVVPPPTEPGGSGKSGGKVNPAKDFDMNNDGRVNVLDLRVIINAVNYSNNPKTGAPCPKGKYCDLDRDGKFTQKDAELIKAYFMNQKIDTLLEQISKLPKTK